ncbi:M3 family oligoendopeptidase, partial [Campylobacter coli]|nr:M3 family oligoendopeptidase [Campylobacter coli]
MLTWDLGVLFKNEDELENTTQNYIQQSKEFKKNYSTTLDKLNPDDFLNALKEYEHLHLILSKIMTYAYLCFAKNSSKGSFYAKYEQECKKIEENLLFFELEFCELSEEKTKELIKFCKGYDFYLQNLLQNKRYNLSQKEERIMLYLSNTGANAFSRLFDESMTALKIPFEGNKLSEEEILSKLYNNDRKIRKKAAKK